VFLENLAPGRLSVANQEVVERNYLDLAMIRNSYELEKEQTQQCILDNLKADFKADNTCF